MEVFTSLPLLATTSRTPFRRRLRAAPQGFRVSQLVLSHGQGVYGNGKYQINFRQSEYGLVETPARKSFHSRV